jgi:DNA primase
VLNLLRYGIKNSIAVGGTNVPQPVADLCKKKTVTAFTDGDRGGELIIKELLQVADIDFIARAPDGKGVEELVQKEILKSLRQKIPVEQAFDYYQVSKKRRFAILDASRKKLGGKGGQAVPRETDTEQPDEEPEQLIEQISEPEKQKPFREIPVRETPVREPVEEAPKEVKRNVFQEHISQLSGSLSARMLDESNNIVHEVPVRDLATALKDINGNITSVVFDGVITQRIVDIASEKGISNLVGAKIGNLVKTPTSIHIEASTAL